MEGDGAGRAVAPEHQRARIVTEHGEWHAAEMDERGGNALTPLVLALVQKCFHEDAA